MTKNKLNMKEVVINGEGLENKELNDKVENAIIHKTKKITLTNINGHRYISNGIKDKVEIEIHGTAGDDLGSFMDGPKIIIHGNAQDGLGNTMNNGIIIVHGDARDIVGHSMRGGKIMIDGDVGYRVGIHMKEYKGNFPTIIAAGVAGDFLGEYMAGGRIIILGINDSESDIIGDWIATGIHGGIVYIRGSVPERKLGVSAKIMEIDKNDMEFLNTAIGEFCEIFGYELKEIIKEKFIKIVPSKLRPFGEMYTE
jgi:glutamate synthase domain-containing protein 3|tara:strand:+ start:1192 stop:1953 length:762 start_codon:yes stop_codon:yes gene_type:complete